MNSTTQFIIQNNDCIKTKKGQYRQEFMIVINGITKGMYAVFVDESYKQGIYALENFNLLPMTSNGYTNLQVRDPSFKFIKEYKAPSV